MKNIPDFIRCTSCQKVTTKEIVLTGKRDGCRCGRKKFVSTNPSLFEEILFLIKHPTAVKFLAWGKK